MIFFISSTRKSDRIKNPITLVTSDIVRAEQVARRYFNKKGYKGRPYFVSL